MWTTWLSNARSGTVQCFLVGTCDHVVYCLVMYCICVPVLLLLTFVDAIAFTNSHFGGGVGSVFLNWVACGGEEDSLLDCSYIQESCSHANDAGVRCQGCYPLKNLILQRANAVQYISNTLLKQSCISENNIVSHNM